MVIILNDSYLPSLPIWKGACILTYKETPGDDLRIWKGNWIMDSRDRKKQKDRQTTLRMLTLISQFGINMLVPIFLCFFAGMYLDRYFETNYLTVLLFFVGALAGFRNVYLFAKRATKKQQEEKQEKN